MAKVVIEVDTKEQTLKITVDGKEQKNVRDVFVSTKDSGYFGLEIAMFEKVDDTMRQITRLVASVGGELIKEAGLATDKISQLIKRR